VSIKLFNDGYNSRKTENKRAVDTRMNGAPKISFDSTTTSAIVTENRKKGQQQLSLGELSVSLL
jgi:hypothetical protein